MIQKRFALVSILFFCVVAMGCSSMQLVKGSAGGMKAYMGPLLIEAKIGKRSLPKFWAKNSLHIVGESTRKFSLSLKNRTEQRWELRLRGDKGKRFILWPKQKVALRTVSLGSKETTVRFPTALDAKKIRNIEFAMFPLMLDQSERFLSRPEKHAKKPSFKLKVTYGVCIGYQDRRLYSRWCPNPNKPFYPTSSPIPSTVFLTGAEYLNTPLRLSF